MCSEAKRESSLVVGQGTASTLNARGADDDAARCEIPDGHVLQLADGVGTATSSTLTQQVWRKHPAEICLWLRQDDPATPTIRCYFLLHVDDSLTIGRKPGAARPASTTTGWRRGTR